MRGSLGEAGRGGPRIKKKEFGKRIKKRREKDER